jgi:uncharacterized protein HemX
MKYIFITLIATALSGCSLIKPTPSQEEIFSQLQEQLQTLIQENEAIQAGSAVYNENVQKIQALEYEIEKYRSQLQNIQNKVDTVKEWVNNWQQIIRQKLNQ